MAAPAFSGKTPFTTFPLLIVRPLQFASAPFPICKMRNSGAPGSALRWMVAPLPLMVRSRPAASLTITGRPFAPLPGVVDRGQRVGSAGREINDVGLAIAIGSDVAQLSRQ